MKLLLDMGLAPRTADYLNRLGHDASHLRDRGQARLALQRLARPSVILFRLERFTTDEVNAIIAGLLTTYESELSGGAIVVVDSHKVRLRMLPIW